jgi:hypothetical protein
MPLQKRNQDGLWKHMAKTCAVRLMSNEDYKLRKALFASAIDDVNSGSYSPRRIHGFLSAPKGASVARFIPVLTCIDTAVYFACVQHIDKKLAGAAIEHTFGGWQLGTARREMEEQGSTQTVRRRRMSLDATFVLQPGRMDNPHYSSGGQRMSWP